MVDDIADVEDKKKSKFYAILFLNKIGNHLNEINKADKNVEEK